MSFLEKSWSADSKAVEPQTWDIRMAQDVDFSKEPSSLYRLNRWSFYPSLYQLDFCWTFPRCLLRNPSHTEMSSPLRLHDPRVKIDTTTWTPELPWCTTYVLQYPEISWNILNQYVNLGLLCHRPNLWHGSTLRPHKGGIPSGKLLLIDRGFHIFPCLPPRKTWSTQTNHSTH